MTREPVTIALVTYNSARFVGECIAALPAAFGDVPWHLVVADNASSDDTLDAVTAACPSAEIVALGRNAGYAAAINDVVARARGDVLVLNPDTVMAPGSAAAFTGARRRPGVGIVVPRVVDPDGRVDRSLRRTPTLLRAAGEAALGGGRAGRHPRLGEVVHDPSEYARGHRVDWALGAVMLVSRECLDAVGPWDESFFLYSEETDFCLRAADLGFATWYEPDALVVHVGGESGTSARLWTILTLNRVRLYRKRHGALAGGAFWGIVTIGEALRARRPGGTHREALSALRHGPGAVERELARRCPPGAGPAPPAQPSSASNTAT